MDYCESYHEDIEEKYKWKICQSQLCQKCFQENDNICFKEWLNDLSNKC